MEILRNLDFVEILKTGVIGLGFLLALLSYLLLRQEQRKKEPSKIIVLSTIFFMVFSIVITGLGVLSQFIDSSGTLSLTLGDNELKVSEIETRSLSELDIKKYYVNSEQEFVFAKPNDNWSSIKSYSGITGVYKLMGIKSQLVTEENLARALQSSPIGSLLSAARFHSFENLNTKINVSPTDSVTNYEIEIAVQQYSSRLADTTRFFAYDTTDIDEKREFEEEIVEYRKRILGFDSLEVKESFVLYVLPKDSLSEPMKKLKLPALFTALAPILGVNADKLVASEDQIIIGAESEIKNLASNNINVDIKVKKWMLFTESNNYFFIIELTYPLSLNSSVDRWDELQEILNSFTLIE